MPKNLLDKVVCVSMDPFPHAVVRNALPEDLFIALNDAWPEREIDEQPALDNGITKRMRYHEVLKRNDISDVWLDFFAQHTGPYFFNRFLEIFNEAIEDVYGTKFLDRMAKKSVSLRNIDNETGTITSDCQFVQNEVIGSRRTSRTPHLDNPREIFGALFYLRQNEDLSRGGDLELYDFKGIDVRPDINKGREVVASRARVTKTVEYCANTFIIFLNTPLSVHGVSPRLNAQHRRRSVNVIAELPIGDTMWVAKSRTSPSLRLARKIKDLIRV